MNLKGYNMDKNNIINSLGKSFSELDIGTQKMIEERLDENYVGSDQFFDCKVEDGEVYALVESWLDAEDDSLGYVVSSGDRLDLEESGEVYGHDDIVRDWSPSSWDNKVWVNVKEL